MVEADEYDEGLLGADLLQKQPDTLRVPTAGCGFPAWAASPAQALACRRVRDDTNHRAKLPVGDQQFAAACAELRIIAEAARQSASYSCL